MLKASLKKVGITKINKVFSIRPETSRSNYEQAEGF